MRNLLFLSFFFVHSLAGADCKTWFSKTKIKHGKNCVLDCSTAKVDMGSFACPAQCPDLCKAPLPEKLLFQLSDLYPGLTKAEKALAAKNPKKLLRSYFLTWKAESLCLQNYKSSQTNDESDACRHFCWAALLNKEYGSVDATDILNAHEQDPKQPENERAMDLANNRLGILSQEKLEKEGNLGDDKLLEEFERNLEKGNLVIVTPLPNNRR